MVVSFDFSCGISRDLLLTIIEYVLIAVCGVVGAVQCRKRAAALGITVLPCLEGVIPYIFCQTYSRISKRFMYYHIIPTLANILVGEANVVVANISANVLRIVTSSMLKYPMMKDLSLYDVKKGDNERSGDRECMRPD